VPETKPAATAAEPEVKHVTAKPAFTAEPKEVAAVMTAAAPAVEPVIAAAEATVAAAVEAKAKVETAASAVTAEVTNEILERTTTMQNEATKLVNENAQIFFGDINERAKTAMERSARVLEEMTDLTRGNVEALVASSKVAAKGVETLSQEAAEFGRKSFEDASAAVRTFAEVRSPTDFFRVQSEFAKSQFDSLVSESSKLSEAVLKLAGDVAEPLTSRYSVAAERVKGLAA
jgi:phasin family protein